MGVVSEKGEVFKLVGFVIVIFGVLALVSENWIISSILTSIGLILVAMGDDMHHEFPEAMRNSPDLKMREVGRSHLVLDYEHDDAKDVFPKIKEILITTDCKASTKNSIDYGIKLAKNSGAKLHAIYVIDTAELSRSMDAASETIYEELKQKGHDYVLEKAKSEGLEVITDTLEGHPAEEIIKYAEKNSIDLIVMRTTQKSGWLDRFLLGSVSEKVVRSSKIPVLLVPESQELREEHMPGKNYKKILIATDGAENTKNAIDYAIELAKNTEETLYALYVIDTAAFASIPMDAAWESMYERLKNEGCAAINYIIKRVADEVAIDRLISDIVEGHPAEEIIKYAENNSIDLIVMGTSGKSGLDLFFLGSVAEKVVRSSKIPVLVARGKICYEKKSNGLDLILLVIVLFFFTVMVLSTLLWLFDLIIRNENSLLVLLGFIAVILAYRRIKKEKR